MALLSLLALIVISGMVNNSILGRELVILQLAIYMAAFFFMRRAVRRIDRNQMYIIIRSIIIIIVVIGAIQWVTTMFVPSARFILKYLIYNDNSEDIYFNFSDAYHSKRVFATFMEPSYMAAFAVGSFYYLLCFWDRIKENIIILLALVSIIVFSVSSTAYVSFAITGILFMVTSKELKTKWKMILASVAIVMILIFFFGFYDVLDKVLFSKATSGSGLTRSQLNKDAYEVFLSSPIIGIGYKAVRGSSIIHTLLGELGILGLVSFFLFNVCSGCRVIFRNGDKEKYSSGYYGVMYAVITSFICLIIACPDLDLCSYWFWLYLLGCYSGLELIKYKSIRI
jgi:O-antigen ligase